MTPQTGDPVGIQYEDRFARSRRLVAIAWRLIRSDRAMMALALAGALLSGVAVAIVFGFAGFYDDGRVARGRLMLAVLVSAWPVAFVGT
jgi:hypothetical protein